MLYITHSTADLNIGGPKKELNYMLSKKTLARLRGQLEKEVANEEPLDREGLKVELSAQHEDPVDALQETAGVMLAVQEVNATGQRMTEVRRALQRMDRGTFGVCLGCDQEIGLKRLAAVPWALLCLTCQAAKEKNGGVIPNPSDSKLAPSTLARTTSTSR
jgi:DnaK suppressor protein